jgi:hypothetical protein
MQPVDTDRFDALLAALTAPSRRTAFRVLGGLGLAGLFGQTDAKKKKKKRCAKAGRSTSKKRKKCCEGLVKDSTGHCVRRGSFASCVPRACPANSCGSMPDGCGGTLNCGGCPANEICLRSNVCQSCSILCTGMPDQCGETLHQALEAGGTYFVCPGLYRRQLGFVPGDDPVTLVGAGQGDDETSNTVLESGGNTRVLEIPSGKPPLTLERVQIRNGRIITTDGTHIAGGGVLLRQGSALHMTECTVRRNDLVNHGTAGTRARGGGIATEQNSTLEMTRCTVRENNITINSPTITSGQGGGIWTLGTTTLTDCLVEVNSAATTGGGLSVEGGKTTLFGSTHVRLNRAQSAAGIDVNASELESAVTCRVTQNISPNGAGPGGIVNTNGMVTLAGPDPSPIVVDNCPDNCNFPAVPKCSTAPPVSCPF